MDKANNKKALAIIGGLVVLLVLMVLARGFAYRLATQLYHAAIGIPVTASTTGSSVAGNMVNLTHAGVVIKDASLAKYGGQKYIDVLRQAYFLEASASPSPSGVPSSSPTPSAQPSPSASSSPATPTCPNKGLASNGSCWYLGKTDERCDITCMNAGLTYSEQTKDMIGSSGAFISCVDIAHKMKLTILHELDGATMGSPCGTNPSPTPWYGCPALCSAFGENGTGCYMNLVKDLNRNTACTTTANGHDPTIKRICGCKPLT